MDETNNGSGPHKSTNTVLSMDPLRGLWWVDQSTKYSNFACLHHVHTRENSQKEPIHSSDRKEYTSSFLLIVNIVVLPVNGM